MREQDLNQISLLCVDNDAQSRRLLRYGLEAYGYTTYMAGSGEEAIRMAGRKTFDLITTAINLGIGPGGIEICQTFRECCKTPIIVIAEENDKKTKLTALDAGADDYITKPFDLDEVEARIRAILRRSAIEDGSSSDGEIRVDGLVINLVKHRVVLDGKPISLTPREFALLRVLASNPGKAIAHSILLKEVWHKDDKTLENTLRVYVNKLRKKLGECSANQHRYIFNEPGVGYRFVDM